MNSMLKLALLGAAAISLVACQKQAGSGSDPDAAKKAVQADEKKMNAEFKAKDSAALVAHYADDAFFVAPGVKANGSTEIRKAYAVVSTDKNFDVRFGSDRIDVGASGDLAYARGHFDESYTDEKSGKAMTGSGTYITVYRKQQDGGWKVVEDIAAADPATVKEVPPQKPAVRAKMTSF